MKYIKKITLENFQSHKFTELELIEGLNIIVGPSDSGKTAIIRALKWALYNEPSGDFFIREGETQTSVSIEFNDNTKLIRMRGKSKNIYLLTTNKGEEYHFEGFGTSVPEEIIYEIGIKKSLLDDTESKAINLGEQLDGAFLLSERSSVRASAIGRIVGVNIIDDALKEALKDLRNYSINKRNLDGNLEQIQKELLNYDYLSFELSRLNRLKDIKNKLSDKLKFRSILLKYSTQFTNLQFEKKLANTDLEKIQCIGSIEYIIAELDILLQNKKLLNSRFDSLNKCRKEINDMENILLSLNDIIQLENNFNKIVILNNRMKRTLSIKHQFEKVLNSTNTNLAILNKLNNLDKYNYKLNSIDFKNEKLNKLIFHKNQYEIIKKRIISGTEYLKMFKQHDRLNNILNTLELNILHIDKLILVFNKYNTIHIELEEVTFQLANIIKKIQNMKSRYKELLSVSKICPYCFSTINHEKIEDITDKL